MSDLAGKTALVTGGASGIGLATVERFARRGARVALNYLPGDPRGPAAVGRLAAAGLQVIGAPGDVATPGEAEAMVRDAVSALGRLDFLANNAGTSNTVEPIPPADMAKRSAAAQPLCCADARQTRDTDHCRRLKSYASPRPQGAPAPG